MLTDSPLPSGGGESPRISMRFVHSMGQVFPILPAVRPPSIGDSPNGQIPLDRLVNVRRHENYDVLLAPEMAQQYRRLCADCLAATGVSLGINPGGAYRSFDQQVDSWNDRWERPVVRGRPIRTWPGHGTYSLRMRNGHLVAKTAVPGTSNHGLGAAVDLMVFGEPDPNLHGSRAWEWMLANAVDHGLSWELQDEPWHLRLVALPSESNPIPPPEEDEVALVLFRVDTHPDDLYQFDEATGETRHITAFEGAIRGGINGGWANNAVTISLPDDVNAALP
jgi:D-alanyl-D-alanine carboxypeptidase